MILINLVHNLISEAIVQAKTHGFIPRDYNVTFTVERPQNKDHGDFATNLPLRLAGILKMNPVAIGERILPLVTGSPQIQKMWIQPPGFINFSLSENWVQSQVDQVVTLGDSFGNTDFGNNEKLQVEFVSVNPTGPVHVGHTRGAVLGDTLSRILAAAGYDVTKEYYVNDTGNQMETFYQSLYIRYKQRFGHNVNMPENGYMGDYMIDIAGEISEEEHKILSLEESEGIRKIGKIGLSMMLNRIESDLQRLGINFDVWFREYILHDNGHVTDILNRLIESKNISVEEGATWLKSSSLGEDKDNVLIRSNGSPTYFAADIAYHYDKFANRQFSKVIDIWGADHQGHVSRMKTALGALGLNEDRLIIILSQLVTLKQDDQLLKVSKRSGDLITLPDLLDYVGADACRYFFLSRSPDSQMEFDLDLARKESSENPVYYIQYAHARISSIIRLAEQSRIDIEDGDVELLTNPAEIALIKKILTLPELIESIAINLEPHHLAHYSQELATAFHWFYRQCRVISTDVGDENITKARAKLVKASGIALKRCLQLMGMTAPETM